MVPRKKKDMETTRGEMTVKEAGKKGGETTAATHGREFYEDIGHKGGEATAATHNHEFYQEIGHMGGEVGGKKGGERVRELAEKGKEHEKEE